MSLTIIMLQRFAMEHHESRLREPEHFIRDENKCTVIYLCP